MMPPPTAGRSGAEARQHLLDLLGPVVEAAGYDLEDVTVTAAGRRSLVRVSVDADGGIDLDAVAAVTRAVSDVLDTDADGGSALAGPYVLEVSSPGVDRPLTEARHWRRAVGRLVEVPVGDASVTGRVIATSEDGVTLDIEGATRTLVWGEFGRGKVQVEFNAPGAARDTGPSAEEG
jgi:ribosome maturation factor RimP